MDPFRGRVLRRSPPPGVLPNLPSEEPDLPPTPTEKGLSDLSSINTSPLGIHNTPSKRARRSKALAEKLKSSPLKQPPLRPPEFTGRLGKSSSQPIFKQSRFQEDTPQDPFRIVVEPPRDDAEEKLTDQLSHPHPSRKVQEFDPLAEKKAIRDSLRAEVAQLENDIEFASRENDRLCRYHQTEKARRDDWTNENTSNILSLLRRQIVPQEPKQSKEDSGDLLLAALNPIAFLPFNKANQPIPSLVDPSRTTESEKEGDSPVPSHYPITMSTNEELPYLQVFTPLTFTSTISILPREDLDGAKPLMQKHAISVSSSPPGLFAARVEMTVNTKTLSVSELSVPQLDPSARRELQPFVQRIIHGGNHNSALTRNVSVITWAMGEWVRLATRRARFWCAVERELTSPKGIAKCMRQMKKSNNKRRKVGRGRPPAGDADTDTDGEDNDELEEKTAVEKKNHFSRADLMRYMGKNSFDLDLPGLGSEASEEQPSVRIQWKIELDWTGEARSKIGLFVAAPAKCKFYESKASWCVLELTFLLFIGHGNDKGRKSLAGIPAMFDQLIRKDEDPMDAVKTVVALLAGDGRS